TRRRTLSGQQDQRVGARWETGKRSVRSSVLWSGVVARPKPHHARTGWKIPTSYSSVSGAQLAKPGWSTCEPVGFRTRDPPGGAPSQAVTSPVVRAPPVALTAARQFRIRTGFPGAHRRIWFGEQTSTIIQAVRCDRGLTHACGTSLVREPVTPADSPEARWTTGSRWATGSADEGGISVRTWRSAILG